MDPLVEASVSEKLDAFIFSPEEADSLLLPTDPHSDLTQKNIIRIVTAVQILYRTQLLRKFEFECCGSGCTLSACRLGGHILRETFCLSAWKI
jgi:hypothetical protein